MARHKWVERPHYIQYPYCDICGVVKRHDGKNKSCRGPVKLRQPEKSLTDPRKED